jgi:hypothetical protein
MTGKPEVIDSSVRLELENALVLTGKAKIRGRQLLPRLFPKLSFPEYAWIGGPLHYGYSNLGKQSNGRAAQKE